jgi:hypothetical protein
MATAKQGQVWSILLRELPSWLARPTERQPHDKSVLCYYRVWRQNEDLGSHVHILKDQARDLLALVLMQRPHAPESRASHKDAKILLLRMALVNAQFAGRELAYQVRETYMGRHYNRLNRFRVFAHPRRHYNRVCNQSVFLPILALGETERGAVRAYNEVERTAQWNREMRRRVQLG